jgi:hypothetical protein
MVRSSSRASFQLVWWSNSLPPLETEPSHSSLPKQQAATNEAATKEETQAQDALRCLACVVATMHVPLKMAQRTAMMRSPT